LDIKFFFEKLFFDIFCFQRVLFPTGLNIFRINGSKIGHKIFQNFADQIFFKNFAHQIFFYEVTTGRDKMMHQGNY